MQFISQEEARIENFLCRVTNAPKSFLLKLLRKKKIQINGSLAVIGTRVLCGDKVFIDANIKINNIQSTKMLNLNIYESIDFFVINKPYGIPSQSGYGIKVSLDECLINWAESKGTKSFITHRLDKNTTGTMVFAKNVNFTREIGNEFQTQKIGKAYITVLEGNLSNSKLIDTQIDNKDACSLFIPICYLDSQTLCLVLMKFGRKHQIRIHASMLCHPLYEDNYYGEGEGNFFLHCFALSFFGFTFFSQLNKKFYYYINKRSRFPIDFFFLLSFYYKYYNENL